MGKINNPVQVVLTSSRCKDKDNLIAMAWWTKVSHKPNLYAISVGKTRFSHDLIKKGKCFTINFMPSKLKNKILFCGKNSGKELDKFEKTGLTKIESKKINCFVLKESLAYAECNVIKSIPAGDHTIFVGEVVNEKVKKKGKRPFQIEGTKFTTTTR